jgi:hypothetical protein
MDLLKNQLRICEALGVGACLMYFFDPNRGRQRRAQVRDQAVAAFHRGQRFLDAACCDLQHRAEGVVAEMETLFDSAAVPDDVLAARVRSKLGRCTSHLGGIEVHVDDGHVTLRGAADAHEVGGLVSCVRGIRGVKHVANELDVQDLGDWKRPAIWEGNLAPSRRLLLGIGGAMLLARGMTQRFPSSCVLGTIGAALIGRACLSDVRRPELRASHETAPRDTEPAEAAGI